MMGGFGRQQQALQDWERRIIVDRHEKAEAELPKVRHVVGLDLGKKEDYTALVLIEVHGNRPGGQVLHVRRVKRWPLNTEYHDIATALKTLFEKPIMKSQTLVIDHTGVGAAVYEIFTRSQIDAKIVPISITPGTKWSQDGPGWKVAKIQLVSVVQALFGTNRLFVAKSQSEATVLMEELQNFKEKVKKDSGNSTFEAWRSRDHDDTVLATAIAAFYAERCSKQLWIK